MKYPELELHKYIFVLLVSRDRFLRKRRFLSLYIFVTYPPTDSYIDTKHSTKYQLNSNGSTFMYLFLLHLSRTAYVFDLKLAYSFHAGGYSSYNPTEFQFHQAELHTIAGGSGKNPIVTGISYSYIHMYMCVIIRRDILEKINLNFCQTLIASCSSERSFNVHKRVRKPIYHFYTSQRCVVHREWIRNENDVKM